jgi:stage V sporulation protein D (sporulation-specific penicillin-binding protein)
LWNKGRVLVILYKKTGLLVKVYSYNRRRIRTMWIVICLASAFILGRLFYIMVIKGEYYSERASELHARERSIKAPRGKIYDRNGNILADNKTVFSVSVIHSQIEDSEQVIELLKKYIDKSEEEIRAKVEKVSSREIIATNVDEASGEAIRDANIAGIKVDEDYKRNYPYNTLASKVIGFTGSDNQGIVGLEVTYDEILQGENGSINAITDAKGIDLYEYAETRVEPIAGNDLITTLDLNIQSYVTQAAEKVLKEKNAERVCAIVMNPQNGEIYAMVDAPEYNLNEPFTLVVENETETEQEENSEAEQTGKQEETSDNTISVSADMDKLNSMWRNYNISDTYEPGSTAKIMTLTAALEKNAVTKETTFYCPGYKIVEDRRIRCHKNTGHGSETLAQALMNSCNPAFMEIGEKVGTAGLFEYYGLLGIFSKSGIDLPGEASSIMHKEENVGPVELATMSFGQSYQITPIQFISAVSTVINGGKTITPHIGKTVVSGAGENIVYEELEFSSGNQVIKSETSALMRELLESVVSEGSGSSGSVEGYRIGGKTATSEKLPRGNGKYISSFIGFAPADNPKVIMLLLIDEPEGTYYGGTVAAPVVADVFSNILPYLGIDKDSTEY